MYVGIDPGKTTGVAAIELSGGQPVLKLAEQMNQERFNSWLVENASQIKILFYEDFLLFKHKAMQQSGSKMEASQIIGAIKLMAATHGFEVVKQPPSIKAIAELKTKLKPPSDHSKSHWIDAYNHLYYGLLKRGLIGGPGPNKI